MTDQEARELFVLKERYEALSATDKATPRAKLIATLLRAMGVEVAA